MPIRSFESRFPTIGENCYVDPTAVVVGDVVVGEESSIWPLTVVRGDVNDIRIGARSNIQDGSVVHVSHDGPYSPGGFHTRIGDDVTVGHKALVHACEVGNRCLVGMGAIIMDGAVLEDDVMLAAGALVSPGKRLQSGFLYRGSPAKQVRPLSDAEKEMLLYSAQHYVRLAKRYRGAE